MIFRTSVFVVAFLASAIPAGAVEFSLHSGTGGGSVAIAGPDDRAQVIAMSKEDRDLTREVAFRIEPPGFAAIDSTGYVTPLKNGKGFIIASAAGENPVEVKAPISVTNFERQRPVSFPNDVIPVITRNHCNAGACHAKASGQNGFQLSLLGYEPQNDFEQITTHSRGRRVTPSAAGHSLLLQKATGDLPHEGGARLNKDSADYATILRWIDEGLNYQPENDPDIERIEVFPRSIVTKPNLKQQLVVTASFSDGTKRDITRLAQYEANHPELAEADERGLVAIQEKTGSTAVLVRFREHIDTFVATIPLGNPIGEMPQPRNFIDEQIFKQLSLMGLPPSKEVDDGAFLRRVTLDIAGRLPTVEETEAFLLSVDPEKRAAKIDALLASPDYADYFAGKWTAILRNKVDRGRDWVARDSHAFHAWVRTSLNENKPFDQFAGELVVASGKAIENPAVSWYRVVKDQKERMENVAQIFLGIRMQCAQCHHHPYEQWSMDDYFSFTAFFSTIETKNIRKLPEEDIYFHGRKPALMKNPASGENMKPKLLGDAEPLEIPAMKDPRFDLANWMRSKENPYLARVLVNRYWKHFFSRGLVEPEDDIRPTNPATHPELLEALADSFRESDFDLKELIRTICNSRTYQLSSDPNGGNADDVQNYARYYPKRLPAEVLLDSVNDITGAVNTFSRQPQAVKAVALPNEKGTQESEFLMMFGRPTMDTACECERTGEANLGQSLHLLNSDTIQKKLTAPNGRAATLAKAEGQSDEARVRELYLQAMSRAPDDKEMGIALAHLKKKREQAAADPKVLPPVQAEQEAFEDIIWVLLNTKEFMFNR
ncbi:DUF1549 and DUF1553 domain-containing protein [Verrucomicrobiales bacterium BCK34]|nr:DUF1549 and DUF1553 domain-containing protein [Verrucomicrobiales bacterium BCK34]